VLINLGQNPSIFRKPFPIRLWYLSQHLLPRNRLPRSQFRLQRRFPEASPRKRLTGTRSHAFLTAYPFHFARFIVACPLFRIASVRFWQARHQGNRRRIVAQPFTPWCVYFEIWISVLERIKLAGACHRDGKRSKSMQHLYDPACSARVISPRLCPEDGPSPDQAFGLRSTL
jgi:hypothetical protein